MINLIVFNLNLRNLFQLLWKHFTNTVGLERIESVAVIFPIHLSTTLTEEFTEKCTKKRNVIHSSVDLFIQLFSHPLQL